MGIEDMVSHIRTNKLTDSRPIKAVKAPQQQPHHDTTDSVCLFGEDSGRIKWIQPSGGSHPNCMAASYTACQLQCLRVLYSTVIPRVKLWFL